MEKIAEKNEKIIDYRFAFLYALGSFLIVLGHVSEYNNIDLLFNWFRPFSFHIALFVFCSGYFYKRKNEENFKAFFVKKFKHLIIPTFIWNLLYGIFVSLLRLKGFNLGQEISLYNLFISPIINGHQFNFNMCCWFVPSLFSVQIITCLLRKVLNKLNILNEYLMFLFYLGIGLIGVCLAAKGYNNSYWLFIVRTAYFFAFYGLGILYRGKLENHDKLNNYIYFTIIFIIQLVIITSTKTLPKFNISWSKEYTLDNIFLPFIVATVGILFWLRVSKIVEPIIKNNKLIKIISDNAFAIMVHQFFGFFIIKVLFAIISKFVFLAPAFSFESFKSNIWYYYYPNNIYQWGIVYVIAGIFIPIGIMQIQKSLFKQTDALKGYIKRNKER